VTLRPPRADDESFQALVRGRWNGTIYLHPSTGEVLGSRGETQGIMGLLFTLHSSLFAGEAGRAILSLAALSYVLMLISGLTLWWPSRWKQALSIRWSASSLRVTFDWHRVTGALFGLLVLISVASGAYMAWPPLAQAVTKLTGVAPSLPPHVTGGPPGAEVVQEGVRRAQATFPDARVGYVQIPSRPDRPLRVRLRLPDDPHPNGLTSVWIHPDSGAVVQVNPWRELDPGTRAYSYIYPLHTGELGGIAWTVLSFLIGAASTGYVVTGALLWWRRR
jgi:uncharacterized iron-regulated membrane protein